MRSARAGPSTQVGWRQVKVSSTFSKVVGVRGRRPCGLSRLRQTQEGRKGFLRKAFRRGLRFRSGRSWARATGTQDPSSGGAGARWAPFSADRAGRRDPLMASSMPRGLPQASLPCPRKRVPSFGTSGRKGQARCLRARSRGYRLQLVCAVRFGLFINWLQLCHNY